MQRILVCDDDDSIRQLLGLTLEDHFEVVYASDGREALDALIGQKLNVDGVVLDVMMPEVDGFEALRRLRLVSQTAELPIVMLTAKVSEQDYLRGFDNGADAYVSKPFDPNDLIETLTSVLQLTPERRRERRDEERNKASLLRMIELRVDG